VVEVGLWSIYLRVVEVGLWSIYLSMVEVGLWSIYLRMVEVGLWSIYLSVVDVEDCSSMVAEADSVATRFQPVEDRIRRWAPNRPGWVGLN